MVDRAWKMGAAFLAAVLAGCAPAGPIPSSSQAGAGVPASARQCFNAASVNGFQVVDSRTVDLIVGANRVFRVDLLGTCPDLRDSVAVGVRTRGGSSHVCDDNDLELIAPSSLGQRVCPATALRLRPPAELEAERRAR